MQNGERLTLEQIRTFLEGSQEMQFVAVDRQEVYDWVTRTLCEQEYWNAAQRKRAVAARRCCWIPQ